MGHKVETYPYMVRTKPTADRNGEEREIEGIKECTVQDTEGFGPGSLLHKRGNSLKGC